jgi:hypothetical protein
MVSFYFRWGAVLLCHSGYGLALTVCKLPDRLLDDAA